MPYLIAKSARTGQHTTIDDPDAVVEEISGQMRKVVMRSTVKEQRPDGTILETGHEAIDYVPVEHLDQYTAEARTRWQEVLVEDPSVHNAGPGGDDQHLYAEDHPVTVKYAASKAE